MILIMCTAIDPSLTEDRGSWSDIAHAVLDEMISRGNMVARFRKVELQKLASILAELPPMPPLLMPHLILEHEPDPIDNRRVTFDSRDGQIANPGLRDDDVTGMNNDVLESAFLQDDLNEEQLMLIADTLDLDGLDWMTTSLGDSSTQFEGF
ncbi:hypothetical protein H2198_006142 [Neophaeococcomyces mojaviensis]|uniref:Uncharacterized protein n=1 Tax=Neophaeococcomyces mojaviensis TaxID=3383035 RepID=A0ACC3A428_9EURO|nr:hypothetical protein H2198_006142 [Knufia sp. JES_112]